MSKATAILSALAIAASASATKPLLRTHGDCWALGWIPGGGDGPIVVAGTSKDTDLMAAAMSAARLDQSLLWYPWVSPQRLQPGSTPMSDCFAQARETCRSQGEKVCFAYYIQFPGGGFSCNFGCSVDGVCAEPPPIPPVPQGAVASDFIASLLVQEVMFALWPED